MISKFHSDPSAKELDTKIGSCDPTLRYNPLIAHLVKRKNCSVISKFDSNPQVAGSNPAQWMQYCFLPTTKK